MPKRRSKRVILGVINMGLRGGGLLGRLLLAIYLTKFFALADVGIFGLITGTIGVAPSLLGFGLNFYLNREVIGLPIADAAHKIRDRLGLTFVLTITFLALALASAEAGLVPRPPHMVEMAVIVFLEIAAFDLHMVLVGMRMPILANTILFLRTGAWVYPFMAVTYAFPAERTLGMIMNFWVAGLVFSFALLAWQLRHWPWSEIARRSFDRAWLTKHIRSAWLIYCSDVGLVVFQYLDRFVVSFLLGLALTGVYTFYWSLANGVWLLVTTGVLQIALPDMVGVYREKGAEAWVRLMLRELAIVLATAVTLSALLFAGAYFFLPYLGRPQLALYPGLFPLLLVGMVVRLTSDVANFALYTRGRSDRAYAIINIAGMFISLSLSATCIWLFGLPGSGISLVLSSTIVLCVRLWQLRKVYQADRIVILRTALSAME